MSHEFWQDGQWYRVTEEEIDGIKAFVTKRIADPFYDEVTYHRCAHTEPGMGRCLLPDGHKRPRHLMPEEGLVMDSYSLSLMIQDEL